MIVYAYLTRGHQLVVQPAAQAAPEKYLAVVSSDTGLLTDWALIVRYAEATFWTQYAVHTDGRPYRIAIHGSCRQKTYIRPMLSGPQRKNLDGTEHVCPKAKRK